jgi:hypothetical protein
LLGLEVRVVHLFRVFACDILAGLELQYEVQLRFRRRPPSETS